MSNEAGQEAKFVFSDGFEEWFETLGVTLHITCYDINRLISIGIKNRQIQIDTTPLERVMGLSIDPKGAIVASRDRLSLYSPIRPDTRQTALSHAVHYVPRVSWYTGETRTHDVGITSEDRIVFVNTAFDCLATVDYSCSFRNIWQPRSQDGLPVTPHADRCHLNGMCIVDGTIRYLTSLGNTQTTKGWRETRLDGGCLWAYPERDPMIANLSIPHSPRMHEGVLWLLNSGSGELGYIDPRENRFVGVEFCAGFARGLSFRGKYAFVGVSDMKRLIGPELEQRLAARSQKASCHVLCVDVERGNAIHWIKMPNAEIYDVCVSDSGPGLAVFHALNDARNRDVVLLN